MESEVDKSKREDGCDSVFDESVCESRESSRWSWHSRSSSDLSSPAQLGWLIRKPSNLSETDFSDVKYKSLLSSKSVVDNVGGDESKLVKQTSKATELEMMMERFSKLLLGEDMSGGGKGVCTAMALSNAITNLYATVFSQLWRLEPLPSEKKSMWQREMDWLLCVSDYIVEMIPSWQMLPDGNRVEVMSSRPRLDLVINLPALKKLDNMLLEILDGFTESEFWYVDQGIGAPGAAHSVSFRKAMQRQEEKWWLPVPRVPPNGLSESTRKRLSHNLECTSQILKAASAINSSVLAEMDVPKSYLETLPKSARACLGDIMYRCITSEHFSPDYLIDCLDLASEHAAVEMANRVESAIYVWIRRLRPKHPNLSSAKSSWEIVRNHMVHGDKQELFIVRAENILISLKQRFPGLAQTTLDASKIHCNKDVGKSILESYSRVLEGLASSILTRIEDLIYVDDLNKQTDKLSSLKLMSTQKAPILFPVSVSGPAYGTASYPSGNSDKSASRGLGPKNVVVNYIGGDEEVKDSGFIPKGPGPASASHGTDEGIPSSPSTESSSVVDETRTQALGRYYMYSALR